MKILGLIPIQIFGAIIVGIVFSFAIVTLCAPQAVDTSPVPTPEPVIVDHPVEHPVAEQYTDRGFVAGFFVVLGLIMMLVAWGLAIIVS